MLRPAPMLRSALQSRDTLNAMETNPTRSTRAALTLLVAALLLVVLPEAVAACPVCFDSSDENRMAFLATTAFLSLLPLGMVAGAGLYIRRRSQEREDDPYDPDRPEP